MSDKKISFLSTMDIDTVREKNREIDIASEEEKKVSILSSLNIYAVRKKNREKNKPQVQEGDVNGIGYLGGKLVNGAFSLLEGTYDLVVGTAAKVFGNTEYADYLFKYSTPSADWDQYLTEGYNPGKVMSFMGDAMSGVGQSATFLIPGAGQVLFTTGVFGNSISEYAQATGSTGFDAYLYGGVEAAKEWAIERWISGPDATLESVARKGGKSIAGKTWSKIGKKLGEKTAGNAALRFLGKTVNAGFWEGVEEVVGDLADYPIQHTIGYDNEYKVTGEQLLRDFAVAFTSSALMQGVGQAGRDYRHSRIGARVSAEEASRKVTTARNLVESFARVDNKSKSTAGAIQMLEESVNAYGASKEGYSRNVAMGEILDNLAYVSANAATDMSARYIAANAGEELAKAIGEVYGVTLTVQDLRDINNPYVREAATLDWASAFAHEVAGTRAETDSAIDQAVRDAGGTVETAEDVLSQADPAASAATPGAANAAGTDTAANSDAEMKKELQRFVSDSFADGGADISEAGTWDENAGRTAYAFGDSDGFVIVIKREDGTYNELIHLPGSGEGKYKVREKAGAEDVRKHLSDAKAWYAGETQGEDGKTAHREEKVEEQAETHTQAKPSAEGKNKAPEAKEKERASEEHREKSEKRAGGEEQEREASSETRGKEAYSYEALTKKDPLTIVPLTEEVPMKGAQVDRKKVIDRARQNVLDNGGRIGQYSELLVEIPSIEIEALISKAGLEHGMTRKDEITALSTMRIGEILKNAIAVNELEGRRNASKPSEMSYVLLSVGEKDGKVYLVRSIVNKKTKELAQIQAYELYATKTKDTEIDTKKRSAFLTASKMPGHEGSEAIASAPYLRSEISIAELLEEVKGLPLANEVFSEDVTEKLGVTRNQGTLSSGVRYDLGEEGAPTAEGEETPAGANEEAKATGTAEGKASGTSAATPDAPGGASKKTMKRLWESNAAKTARKAVRGFDFLDVDKRLSILRMVESAEKNGKAVDTRHVQALAVLMTSLDDTEVIFTSGTKAPGSTQELEEGSTLILIDAEKASQKGSVSETVLHEIWHRLSQSDETMAEDLSALIDETDHTGYQSFFRAIADRYSKYFNGQSITEWLGERQYTEKNFNAYFDQYQGISREKVIGEASAAATGRILAKSNFVNRVVARERGGIRKILNSIGDFAHKMVNHVAEYGGGENTPAFSLAFREVQKVRTIYEGALVADAVAGKYIKTAFDFTAYDSLVEERNEADAELAGKMTEDNVSYDLGEDVWGEESRELIAIHNLTEEQLRKTVALGGFPMPSIAIIKKGQEHSDFGDISVIFNKNTIDPKRSKHNKVYGTDAWTQTFPAVDYKANEAVMDRIYGVYKNLEKKYGHDTAVLLYRYYSSMEEKLAEYEGEEGLLKNICEDTDMMQVFLADSRGISVDPVIQEKRIGMPEEEAERAGFLIETLGEEAVAEYVPPKGSMPSEHITRVYEKNREAVQDACRKYLTEKKGLSPKEAEERDGRRQHLSMIRAAVKYLRQGGVQITRETDVEATKTKIRNTVDTKAYREWVNGLFAGVEETKGIRNGKDLFTAGGTRRTFEALHYELTLENIVKVLRSQAPTGQSLFAANGIWGAAAKEYHSIDEIRADSSRLYRIGEDEHQRFRKRCMSRLSEIADSIAGDRGGNRSIAIETALENILDTVKTAKTDGQALEHLKKYHPKATAKTVEDIKNLVAEIAEAPTGYFEAKPQRAVYLSEIAVVELPAGVSKGTVDLLKREGIPYDIYGETEEDRKNRISLRNDLMFDLGETDPDRMTEEQRAFMKKQAEVKEKFESLGLSGEMAEEHTSLFATAAELDLFLKNTEKAKAQETAKPKAKAPSYKDGRVHSKKEAVDIYRTLMEEIGAAAGSEVKLAKGTAKEQIVSQVYRYLNSHTYYPESIRKFSKNIAERLVRAATYEDYDVRQKYYEAVESGAAEEMETIKSYFRKLSVESIREDIVSYYGKERATVILRRWNGGDNAIDISSAVKELQEEGFAAGIDSKNAADILIRLNERYESLQEALSEKREFVPVATLASEDIQRLVDRITDQLVTLYNEGGRETQFSQLKRDYSNRVERTTAETEARISRVKEEYRRRLEEKEKKWRKTFDKLQTMASEKIEEIRSTAAERADYARELVRVIQQKNTLSRYVKGDYRAADAPVADTSLTQLVALAKKTAGRTQLNVTETVTMAEYFAKYALAHSGEDGFATVREKNGNYEIAGATADSKESESGAVYVTDEDVQAAWRLMKHDINKPMTAADLEDLYTILKAVTRTYRTYDRIFKDGKWQEIAPMATRAVNGTKEVLETQKQGKKAVQAMRKLIRQYGLAFMDPLSIATLLDNGRYDGVAQMLMRDIVVGAAKAKQRVMEMRSPIDEFMKKHKKYSKKLIEARLTLDDGQTSTEIDLGEAISLVMLAKRDQAQLALQHSALRFTDGISEETREMRADLPEDAPQDLLNRFGERRMAAIRELSSQLDAEDLEFISICEKIFNHTAKDLKKKCDMEFFGFTNVSEKYYFPIRRDRVNMSTNMISGAFFKQINTVDNQSFNKNTVKNANASMAVENVYSVVTGHLEDLSKYAELHMPLQNFTKVYNKNIGSHTNPVTWKNTIEKLNWGDVNKYLATLMLDIQGTSRGGEKGLVDKTVAHIRGGYAMFALGLNAKSVVKQMLTLPMAFQFLSSRSLFLGMGRAMNADKMHVYSAVAAERADGPEIVKALSNTEKVSRVTEKFMLPMAWGDRYVNHRLWNACQYEVQEKQGLALNSEENLRAAGELLNDVILKVQDSSDPGTKSQAARSSNELVKTTTMFKSSPLKTFSRWIESMVRYMTYRQALKNGEHVQGELHRAKEQLIRTSVAMVSTAVLSALITFLFARLYNKPRDRNEDGNEVSDWTTLGIDTAGEMLGFIPLMDDVYGYFVNGYEPSTFTSDVVLKGFKSIEKMTGVTVKLMNGEVISEDEVAGMVRDTVHTAGYMTGMPVRNVENMVLGLWRRVSPGTEYPVDALIYNPNYMADIKSAMKKGDTEFAEAIAEVMMKRTKTGSKVYSEETLQTLVELYFKGYKSVIPKTVGTSYTVGETKVTLDRTQYAAFRKTYSGADAVVDKLVQSKEFVDLAPLATEDNSPQAKAVSTVYKAYYDLAKSEQVAGLLPSRNAALLSYIDGDKLGLVLAYAGAITTGAVETKDRKAAIKKYMNQLGLTKVEQAAAASACGYRTEDVLSVLRKAAAEKKNAEQLIQALKLEEDDDE